MRRSNLLNDACRAARRALRKSFERHSGNALCSFDSGRGTRGSASLEFLTFGIILLLPMIYLVAVFSTVQNAVLTVEGAARHGARIFVSADSELSGSTAVERSVAIALTDHGLDDLDHELTISCSPLSTECGAPGGFATVRLAITVPLPLVPPVLGLETALAVPISAEAAVPFSQFGEDDSE